MPTMVIVGDRDDLAGSPQVLADRIPGAIARTVKGTHLGAVADPAFPAAIVEFVTSVPRSEPAAATRPRTRRVPAWLE